MREKPWGVWLPNLHVVIMKWLDLENQTLFETGFLSLWVSDLAFGT